MRQRPRRQATQLRPGVDIGGELAHQPALAHPRLAEHRDQLHGVLAERLAVAPSQRRQLLAATDQWRRGPLGQIHSRPAAGPEQPPDRHRIGLALDPDGRELLVLEQRPGGPPGRLPHDDPVDRGDALQPCRRVDHVTDHPLAVGGGGEGDQRLTGVDADPHRQLGGGMGLVQLGDRVEHAQRAPYRPLRVVLVDRRDTEDGHDGVADELVQGAPDTLDLPAQPGVEGPQHGPDVLGIGPVRARREPDQVAEEHGDDLALLLRRPGRYRQRRAACPTEPEPVGVSCPQFKRPRMAASVRPGPRAILADAKDKPVTDPGNTLQVEITAGSAEPLQLAMEPLAGRGRRGRLSVGMLPWPGRPSCATWRPTCPTTWPPGHRSGWRSRRSTTTPATWSTPAPPPSPASSPCWRWGRTAATPAGSASPTWPPPRTGRPGSWPARGSARATGCS